MQPRETNPPPTATGTPLHIHMDNAQKTLAQCREQRYMRRSSRMRSSFNGESLKTQTRFNRHVYQVRGRGAMVYNWSHWIHDATRWGDTDGGRRGGQANASLARQPPTKCHTMKITSNNNRLFWHKMPQHEGRSNKQLVPDPRACETAP